MSETIKVSERQNANLDWAFSQIATFMTDNGLSTLRSRKDELIVSVVHNDDFYEEGNV